MSADPAVFRGRVDEDGGIRLDFPHQQRAYCKRVLAAKYVDVVIAEQGSLKTRLQESGFHAMITPWARTEGHRIDDLKRDLLREIFGEREHVNPITGEITMVLREPHTSTLSRVKYSELIERTLEVAASCGHVLEAPHEYRERKRREAERATKRQPLRKAVA
jgi:hypothetical protein